MPVCQPVSRLMCESLLMTEEHSWWLRWRSVWHYIGADVAHRRILAEWGERCIGADLRAGCPDGALALAPVAEPGGSMTRYYHCARCLALYRNRYSRA